jgi:lipid-A-disaccharide synthase-like uncharacterized protein
MQEHWLSEGANMSQIPSLMWAAPLFTELLLMQYDSRNGYL